MSTLRELLSPQEQIANAVQAVLRTPDQRVLIVATKHGNLPQWMDASPRILTWESNSPEVERASIPERVGLVLFFKWIGHRNHKRILDAARERNIFCHPALLGTGEVRRMLSPLAPETPEPVTPPSPAAPKWNGSLFSFVEQHYVYANERGHQKTEAERLLRLAHTAGLTSSLASVATTISTVHRGIDRQRADEQLANTPPPPDVEELLTKPLDAKKVEHLTAVGDARREQERLAYRHLAEKLAPAPAAPVAEKPSVAALVTASATSEAQVDVSLTELLRMLDDAVAVLGLAREHIVDLSTKNAALRSSREALRAKIMGVFEGI